MPVIQSLLIGSTVGALAIAVGVTPTHAASAGGATNEPPTAQKTTRSGPDPACTAGGGAPDECRVETTTSAGDARPVTAAELAAAGDLVSNDGVRLADAATRATISTRTWYQQVRGLYYFNWAERHSGRIYWDGSRVWSTTSTSGFTGSHTCDQGFGIAYSIKVTKCSSEKIGAGTLNEWDYFQVHVVAQGVPLFRSYNMHVRATARGAVS